MSQCDRVPATPPLTLAAPAKINLGLEVTGRRRDGYHDLVTVFVTLALHDTVILEPADELTVDCSMPALAGSSNLVWRAAELLRETARERGCWSADAKEAGARIGIKKRVPVAGGLGGGSSDAVAALVGLRRLWNVPVDDADLASVAARLGADGPFFLGGGAALATGRGDRCQRLELPPSRDLILIHPDVPEVTGKTAHLYRALRASDFSDGSTVLSVAEALRASRWPPPGLIVNTFARAARAVFPGLGDTISVVERSLGSPVHLTGSGPTLYAFVDDAVVAASALASLGIRASPTTTRAWRAGDHLCDRVDES